MSWSRGSARNVLHIYWISWKASEVPFEKIGNAPTRLERIQFAQAWKDRMLYQLSNVEIIVSIAC
jgi:hypothetical protein